MMRRPKIIGDRLGRKLDALAQRPGEKKSSDWYDTRYGRSRDYQSPYNYSPYYFLWTVIADRIRRDKLSRVFEVGCGTGQLAALLLDQGIEEYAGFDFSPKAVEFAKQAAPGGLFLVADARDSSVYESVDCDILVCTEVLEHIEDDLNVVSSFPGGRCIFSVPNYDSRSHVRFFPEAVSVDERYGRYFTQLDVVGLPTAGSATHRIFLADGYRNKVEGND